MANSSSWILCLCVFGAGVTIIPVSLFTCGFVFVCLCPIHAKYCVCVFSMRGSPSSLSRYSRQTILPRERPWCKTSHADGAFSNTTTHIFATYIFAIYIFATNIFATNIFATYIFAISKGNRA